MQENPEAMTALGKMLYDGDGIEKDLNKAAWYFKIASNGDDNAGMELYATLLDHGKGGLQINKKKQLIIDKLLQKKDSFLQWLD